MVLSLLKKEQDIKLLNNLQFSDKQGLHAQSKGGAKPNVKPISRKTNYIVEGTEATKKNTFKN